MEYTKEQIIEKIEELQKQLNESEDIEDTYKGLLRNSAAELIFDDAEKNIKDCLFEEIPPSMRTRVNITPEDRKAVLDVYKVDFGDAYRVIVYWTDMPRVDPMFQNALDNIEDEEDFNAYINPENEEFWSPDGYDFDHEFADHFKTYDAWKEYLKKCLKDRLYNALKHSGKSPYDDAAEHIQVNDTQAYAIIVWRA